MADGSIPHSIQFVMKPPRVDPPILDLRIPCQGKNSDVLSMIVKNPGADRVIYKMTPSKPHKFKIQKYNLFGFVGAVDAKKIDIFPLKMVNSNDFNKHDGFDFEIAPAPKGDLWDPDVVWRAAKQFKRCAVKIKIIEEKPKPKKKSKKKVEKDDDDDESDRSEKSEKSDKED